MDELPAADRSPDLRAGSEDPLRFFERIPPAAHIANIADPQNYRDVPRDWLIALSDVQGSTAAIQQGRYKDVNAVAAATIIALLNVLPKVEVPFVFGGDGAALLIPPAYRQQAAAALQATARMAQDAFDLQLRVGLVPVADVLAAGTALRVARLRISEQYHQAIFTGGGMAHAEYLLKHPQRDQYRLDAAGTVQAANFNGFECRWEKLNSRYEETVSLIVQAAPGTAADQAQVYRHVLANIEAVYGDPLRRRPVTPQQMQVAVNPARYRTEIGVKQGRRNWWQTLRLALLSVGGMLYMRFAGRSWLRYKQIASQATDHEKFDDALRMTLSGTARQRERLQELLEAMHRQGRLFYGVHASRHALLTCLIFDRFGRQVHFVDGADGGYALAAAALKQQRSQSG